MIFAIVLGIFLLPAGPGYASGNTLESGIEQYRAENFEEAIGFLVQAREQHPGSSLAAFYLGLAYKQTGDYAASEKHLRDSLSLEAPVQDAYIELAEVLYILDRPDEAQEYIIAAENAGIDPARAMFLKGLILLRAGKNAESITAFASAKTMDPSLTQAADFQVAMAQVRQQRFAEAKQTLKTLSDFNPSTDLASFAREYERALGRTEVPEKRWRVVLGVAYQYDDNVVLKPSTSIQGADITGESDSSVIATIGAEYRPKLKAPWSLLCQYNLYTNTYFDLNSHNLFTQTLSLVPGRAIPQGMISLPVTYSHIWVHEREYMGLFAAVPTLQYAFHPEHIGQFSIGFVNRELIDSPIDSDEDRDAGIISASAGYIHPFSEGNGVAKLMYEFTHDDADGKNWDNNGNRVSLSLLYPLMLQELNIVAAGDMFFQNYLHTHTVFGKKREDETYTGTVSLRWNVLKDATMNLQYSHVRADSNIAVYDYRRNIYTAGIEYRF